MTDSDVFQPAPGSLNSPEAERDLEARLRTAVVTGFERTVDDLKALVRIPGIAWEAFDPADLRASSEAVRDLLAATGAFDEITIERSRTAAQDEAGDDEDAKGSPAVLATRAAAPGHPTVLLYAHHDVQPPGDDALWSSAPFEPEERDGRLYGRGASDDKAGIMTHVAAIRALTQALGGPDHLKLGLGVFVEGEEEAGSPSFAHFLRDHHDRLRADVIIVADSGNLSVDEPALTVGLRGNVAFTITVSTLEHASHSGMGGGIVPDAVMALSRILASLHDDDGSVAVQGLECHDIDVPEMSEQQVRDEYALLPGVSPIGEGEFLNRVWSRPSITVTGIDHTPIERASNTLAPTVRAKISARIAPGQRADEAYAALQRHILDHAPWGARVEFSDAELGSPFKVDPSTPAVREMMTALSDGWGAPAIEAGIGGSIPFVADLVEQFPSAQILITGVEDPFTYAHSPNESQHLGILKKSILAEGLFLARANASTVADTADASSADAGERSSDSGEA